MMLSLPMNSAADNSYVPHTEAEAQFLRSLKAKGLI